MLLRFDDEDVEESYLGNGGDGVFNGPDEAPMSSLNDHVPELMEKGGFDEIVDKEILNDLGGDDDLVLRRSHVKVF
ncbi:unnamed protein product [Arabidopsis thaliana]|uniref:(thale cress) hypothetical protein n=1 Tax=Arabidopsis thaliana TaxID=3702 RepID=A0A178UZU4_ARATH|nr:hypothetical protein AXX17_AT4G03910 [Arabidopsis thaliana]CAD5326990.1 unnamed protein product [Arabidopsis thaliana]